MIKDGEGKHAIWDQQFLLENVNLAIEAGHTELIFEAHEGSPLESKKIAASVPILLKEVKM